MPPEDPQTQHEAQDDLTDSWLALGQRVEGDVPTAARTLLDQIGPNTLAFGAKGVLFFTISPEGRIAVNPEVPLDQMAEDFLTHLACKRANMTQRRVHLGQIEQQLILLGQADYRHEAAQRAAGREEPPPDAQHQVEMTRAVLEMQVHRLIETGREMATRPEPQPLAPGVDPGR
jgi:hypothetical protein